VSDVLAVALPALITILAGGWLWSSLRRYFPKLLAAHGPVAKEKPWIRFGLGLDDTVVGTWDLIPAWRSVSRDTGDPSLEPARGRARLATLLFVAQLPGVLIEALAIAGVLGSESATPMLVGLASWFVASIPAQVEAIWLSRPEIRDVQMFGFRAYGAVLAVVAGLLLIVGLVVAVVVTLRG
jgi:hypothetical protein